VTGVQTCALPICRRDEARAAYRVALGLTRQDTERRFIERRLAELGQ